MSLSRVAIVASALILASCQTTSFGPGTPGTPTVTARTLDGGIAYVDTFIALYRDRANRVANGRQWFEIPAFLGIFGGAVASAGGASDGGLVGGGLAALANAGNGYYAPRAKAGLYRQASDAMSCVQQVGMDLKPYETALARTGMVDDAVIYQEMRSAAWAIERILAEKLSNAGALPDAAGLAAEYEKLVEERRTRAAEAAALAQAPGSNVSNLTAGGANADQLRAAVMVDTAALTERLQLHADLQLCVIRMKG